jgi:hypothetical protein
MLHHIEANIKIQRTGEPVLLALRSEFPAADLGVSLFMKDAELEVSSYTIITDSTIP